MKLSHYCFDYDYDTYRECENGSSCCENDYCRCGVIENIVIKSIDTDYLVSTFQDALLGKKHKWTDVEKYCFGRLFTAMKMYDTSKYSIHTCGGYYGEELDGASCDSWNEFEKEFKKMMELEDDDKIRFVLEKEYGHVLEELKDAKFEYRLVKYSDIMPPDNYRKVDGECYDFSSAIGICKQFGDKYQIVDGHHRWKKYEYFFEVNIFVVNK